MVPAVVLTSIWVVATHTPVPRRIREVGAPDWLGHGVGYFAMLLFWAIFVISQTSRRGRAAAIGLWLAAATFAAIDELTQPFVNRSAEWTDWFADLTGLTVAIVGVFWFGYFRRKPTEDDASAASRHIGLR